jgi:hypothetical protein
LERFHADIIAHRRVGERFVFCRVEIVGADAGNGVAAPGGFPLPAR